MKKFMRIMIICSAIALISSPTMLYASEGKALQEQGRLEVKTPPVQNIFTMDAPVMLLNVVYTVPLEVTGFKLTRMPDVSFVVTNTAYPTPPLIQVKHNKFTAQTPYTHYNNKQLRWLQHFAA